MLLRVRRRHTVGLSCCGTTTNLQQVNKFKQTITHNNQFGLIPIGPGNGVRQSRDMGSKVQKYERYRDMGKRGETAI